MPAISDTSKATTFTVGKIEEGLAILISDDLQLVEFPFDCLPSHSGKKPIEVGSLVTLQIEHDRSLEMDRLDELVRLQNELLERFGKAPSEDVLGGCLEANLTTHTTVIATWQSWNCLAEANGWRAALISLDCYVNGSIIKSNISGNETTLRLSGLDPGKTFDVQLAFRTSAGTFNSNLIQLSTKSESDFSGLRLKILGGDPEVYDLALSLGAIILEGHGDNGMGEETTHLVASKLSDVEADTLLTARQAGTPIVTPEWLKACKTVGKICPTTDFHST